MKKWISEPWSFEITVTKAEPCRMGLEEGDAFRCQYECPAGFCPKTMAVLHSLCEAARSGGDYRMLGASAANEIDFWCADGAVRFHLSAYYTEEKKEG